MKKVVLIFVLLVALAMGLLYLSSPGTDITSTFSKVTSEDIRELRARSIDFLEDLQYKDFDKASSYHSNDDRKSVDIPVLIERLFAIKPEFMDIMRYEIKDVDIDRSGDRARVKTHTIIKVLNTDEIREPDVILYWRKDPKEGWVMKLESSLR